MVVEPWSITLCLWLKGYALESSAKGAAKFDREKIELTEDEKGLGTKREWGRQLQEQWTEWTESKKGRGVAQTEIGPLQLGCRMLPGSSRKYTGII